MVSLITHEEIPYLKVHDLPRAVRDRHMEWWHTPIPDGESPEQDFEPTSGAVPCPAMYPEGQRQGIGKGQGVNNEATLLVGLRQAPLVGRGHEQSRLAVPSCGIIGAP